MVDGDGKGGRQHQRNQNRKVAFADPNRTGPDGSLILENVNRGVEEGYGIRVFESSWRRGLAWRCVLIWSRGSVWNYDLGLRGIRQRAQSGRRCLCGCAAYESKRQKCGKNSGMETAGQGFLSVLYKDNYDAGPYW
jgi:hypothetical protein